MILQVSDHDPTLFKTVMSHYCDEEDITLLLQKAEINFYMKPFKIKRIGWKQANHSFEKLLKRYSTGELHILPMEWHKNERKIFIWFLICYWSFRGQKLEELEPAEWEQMGKLFFNKDPLFLKFQGLNILKHERKMIWTENDDEELVSLVNHYKPGNWNDISKGMFFNNRKGKFISPKQCRQRWYNHKNEQVIKSPWTADQDYKLTYFCSKVGKRWSKYSKFQNNRRTEHMIKNRFYCIINRVIKKNEKRDQISLMKLSLKLLAKVVSEEERKDIEESINKYEEAERLKENMIPVFRMKIIQDVKQHRQKKQRKGQKQIQQIKLVKQNKELIESEQIKEQKEQSRQEKDGNINIKQENISEDIVSQNHEYCSYPPYESFYNYPYYSRYPPPPPHPYQMYQHMMNYHPYPFYNPQMYDEMHDKAYEGSHFQSQRYYNTEKSTVYNPNRSSYIKEQ